MHWFLEGEGLAVTTVKEPHQRQSKATTPSGTAKGGPFASNTGTGRDAQTC